MLARLSFQLHINLIVLYITHSSVARGEGDKEKTQAHAGTSSTNQLRRAKRCGVVDKPHSHCEKYLFDVKRFICIIWERNGFSGVPR